MGEIEKNLMITNVPQTGLFAREARSSAPQRL